MGKSKEEYILLYDGITQTMNQLEKTLQRLKELQQRAEETYLQSSENGFSQVDIANNLIFLKQITEIIT